MCSWQVKPLLIIVKPPQVISVDPQKYFGVVLVVVLVVANVDAALFSVRPHTCILSLLFNQCFVVVLVELADASHAIVVAILIDSMQKQLGVNQQTSSYNRINATLATVIGVGHGETNTSNTCLLIVVCSNIVGFVSFVVFFLLCDVTSLMTKSLMPLCHLAQAS
jgi:hypothetical protein